MPDETLLRLAESDQLADASVRQQQVRRMLADPKSEALVDNFAAQWLELRNLAKLTPDTQRYPDFDESLRAAMLGETESFCRVVIAEDRSVLDFLDADYTFVNERLARHYGLPGVQGEEFRQVSLPDRRRGGLLTQASILTLTSNPTRTSPVKRGKWILENILGAPPPPPPPGVVQLMEGEQAELLGSLRERMEQHRSNPSCAMCHKKMDALGFGFENYDAIGAWRERDGQFAIDASGELPGPEPFDGPAGLRRILQTSRRGEFLHCLAEKMLTYAVGRAVEPYDRYTVDQIVQRLEVAGLPLLGPGAGGRGERTFLDAGISRRNPMTPNRPISRRTVLRGLGAAITLPLLDAMQPLRALASTSTPSDVPRRMAFFFVPNGVNVAEWTPKRTGYDYDLPSILQPLQRVKDDVMVLSGLTHDKGRANGDGAGDHARSASVFLTAAQPMKTSGGNIRVGTSVDQVAAQQMGQATRFPSLELGCDRSRNSGNCDSGYSCAYSHNISWASPSTPMAKEIDPRLVFERLFGGDDGQPDQQARQERLRRRRSLLDYASDDARRLQAQLGKSDRRKLDEYLTSVRQIERRLEMAGNTTASTRPLPLSQAPGDSQRLRRTRATDDGHDRACLPDRSDSCVYLHVRASRQQSQLQRD